MKVKNKQKTWYVSLFIIFVILFTMRAIDLFFVAKNDVPLQFGSLIIGVLVIVWLGGGAYCLNYFRSAKTLGVLYLLFFFFEIGKGYSAVYDSDLLMVAQLTMAIVGFVLTIIYLKTVQKADKAGS